MPDAVITLQERVAQEAFALVQRVVAKKRRATQRTPYVAALHADLSVVCEAELLVVSGLTISRGFADKLLCIIALLTLASKHGTQDTPWDSVDMEVKLACFKMVERELLGLRYPPSPNPVRAAFNALGSIYDLNTSCSLRLHNPLYGKSIPHLLPIIRDRKRDPRHMSQMQLEILKICLEFGKSHLANEDDKERLNVSDDDVLRPIPAADDLRRGTTMFLGAKLPRKRYCALTQIEESCLEKIAVMTKEGGGDVSKLPIPGMLQSWVEGQDQIVYLSDLFEIILEYLMQLSCEEFEKISSLQEEELAVVYSAPETAEVPQQISEIQILEAQSPARPR